MSGVVGKVVLGAGAGAAGVAAANNGLLDDFSLDSITDLASEVRYETENTRVVKPWFRATVMLHAARRSGVAPLAIPYRSTDGAPCLRPQPCVSHSLVLPLPARPNPPPVISPCPSCPLTFRSFCSQLSRATMHHLSKPRKDGSSPSGDSSSSGDDAETIRQMNAAIQSLSAQVRTKANA